ncbi:LAFE_0D01178g1_1 [Lachancea fermentati]|uniref:60S ribosomal protein L13 n=1 Tax=Lachancea fermentati TaxID=4955 RepID=A0A1G4MAV8_LACFM|nr:LAFE_0D01178g1_1 [Lachancea fermentati]
MAIAKNLPILKNHFRKHWQERVRVHFDQAGKKVSRRQARAAKAARVAPKPLDLLRPVVRAPTVKYNRKVRAGRGFSLAEVKAAGLTPAYARTVGIAVDHRRQNRNTEIFELNVQRLKEYQSKLIVFPRNGKAPEAEQVLSAAATFPIAQPVTDVETRAVEDNGESAYRTLRLARSDKKYKGIREKRAREKAEAEAEKKK